MTGRVVCALATAWLSALPLAAQVTINGAVRGRVLDADGGVVPGAAVTLTNRDTAATLVTVSSADGFQFPRVAPGVYTIDVELQGFKHARHDGVTVTVNDVVALDIRLELGPLSETVTVAAARQPLQIDSSNVSMLIDASQIRDLPLNGKDFQKLTFLAPGMAGQRGNNSSTNVSGSGARDPYNNYVVDGVSANDERQTAGLAPGNFGLQVPNVISTEAVQEFRVITSNADATFGRGSGAQINVITKSGSSTLHGSLYEYLRDDKLDARDFFNHGPFLDNHGNAIVAPFSQHLFGSTLGGPIGRRRGQARHFFFGNFEGFRQRLQQTSSIVLPNAELINLIPGDLGRLARTFYYGQNVVPTTGNPVGTFQVLTTAERAAALAAGFPAALFDGAAPNEAGFVLNTGTAQRDFRQNAFLVRTDHNLTNRISASIRYAWSNNEQKTNTGGIPVTARTNSTEFRSTVSQVVATLTPGQLLEVRGGYLRGLFLSAKRPDLPQDLLALGPYDDYGFLVTTTGTTSFLAPTINPRLVVSDDQHTPQVAALHTWTRGNLTLRSGLDMRLIQVNFINYGFATPTYTFTGLIGPNSLLGTGPAQTESIASVAATTIFGTGGGPPTPLREYRSTQQEYFSQADWRVSDALTVNAGLRYSLFGVYRDALDALANLYAVNPSSGAIEADTPTLQYGLPSTTLAPVTVHRPLYQPDRNNFQPRLGAAWNIGGRGTTVVRGAYGLYHDRIFQLGYSNVANNLPFATSGQVANLVVRLGQPIPINPRVPVVFGIDPTLENPHTHRANATIEQAFGKATWISASYVASRARGLLRTLDPNFAGAFPQASRPAPGYSDVRILGNQSWSDYDALQLQGRIRRGSALSVTATYALSRTRDDSSADAIFSVIPTTNNTGASAAPGFQIGPFVDRPLASDYGPSELDVRHNLVVSHMIELPFGRGRRWLANSSGLAGALAGGWSVAGLATVRTGARFNVTLGRDVNDDGAINDRPALLSGSLEDLYNTGGDRTQFLKTQAEASTRLGVPANVTDPFASIPRNAFHGPLVAYYDASLIKRITAGRGVSVTAEINVFNVFNRPNFRAPVSDLSSVLFGRITGTAANTNPRQLQLGVKVTF
jgi:Carboxypeptidase regulatory-like domain/TonB-dependent Receptor Plug Domain